MDRVSLFLRNICCFDVLTFSISIFSRQITLLERELQNKRVENNKLVADVRSVNEKLVREREINRKMMAESFVKNEIIVGYKRKEAVLKRDIEKIRQDKNAEIEKMRDERKTMLKQHKEEMQAANSANR